MPKIENWTPTDRPGTEKAWEHDQIDGLEAFVTEEVGGDGWYWVFDDPKNRDDLQSKVRVDTKEKALDHIRKQMKKKPFHVKTVDGYVWNVQKNQTITTEDDAYNLNLSDSPVNHEPVFSGTFRNSKLEVTEPENDTPAEDLKEILNIGAGQIRVYYIAHGDNDTGHWGKSYNQIIDYEVIA